MLLRQPELTKLRTKSGSVSETDIGWAAIVCTTGNHATLSNDEKDEAHIEAGVEICSGKILSFEKASCRVIHKG